MATSNAVKRGSEAKVAVTVTGLNEAQLTDIAFRVFLYTQGCPAVELPQDRIRSITADGCLLLVDTSQYLPGTLYVRIELALPDQDFPDGLRTEIAECSSGIVII